MKAKGLVLAVIAVAVIVLSFLVALPNVPYFEISDIRVIGFDKVPSEAVEILSPLYGDNRFNIKRTELEAKLEDIASVKSAKVSFSFPAILSVELERSDADSLLFDGTNYYLLQNGKPKAVASEDVANLATFYCITEISPSYFQYLSRYGATDEFVELLSLVKSVSDENGSLITRIRYDENSSGSFGSIELELGTLFSSIFVRERVSKSRISDSIKVIEKEVGDDPASNIARDMVHYDLYKDTLVRRNLGSR